MKFMTSVELRTAFLEFFKQKGHQIVPSSSLVPANDPTLLFTNAGMVQFKDVFLGFDKRSYTRAATAQRCVRAGGKHNDLENVGYTARHHTFFEMLGNFSFGDYFKREAIQFAWEFLTQVLQLPPAKLWVTVYEEDDEAADIWLNEIKVDKQRFSRCGAKDNFWAMGDTGPCGPCSEIFYDHGPEVAGGPPGSPDADGDRYIEIWNLVFMQFDRAVSGELTPLPKPSVDTGMGLERLAAVIQGVHNNYDIDLFRNLIQTIARLTGSKDLTATSLRVIADHIRSTSFLITDGVIPSNEGRGYVLRRIIRRAIRHGNKLGLHEPFFHQLVAPLVAEMGKAYPELAKAQSHIEKVLLQEEQQFARTLEQGLKVFEQDVAALTGKLIPGETVFRLYDTYGFPVDLTADIARERYLEIDLAGFEREMEKQRQQSQSASKFASAALDKNILSQHDNISTQFLGYEYLHYPAKITALYQEGEAKQELATHAVGAVILEHTPFYAESGGQVGDQGILQTQTGGRFEVTDTRKEGQLIIHYGKVVTGHLRLSEVVDAQVDINKRQATALNHSATHLLHAALRQILGEHVLQKGSLVAPDRLRFDFAHYEVVTAEQLVLIERLVNQQIRANVPVETNVMPPEEAIQQGAMALFGEKYGELVRVLRMGDFSVELCGGTHVKRTGDIGLFKIISETGIAAGVRRIEAITGAYACAWIEALETQLNQAGQLVKANRDNFIEKLTQTVEQNRQLEKHVEQLTRQQISVLGNDLAREAEEINGVKVVFQKLQNIDVKFLRDIVDQLKSNLESAIIVLVVTEGERINVIAGITKNCTDRIHANELINLISQYIGGKGGGRPDMAQAGGTKPEGLSKAREAAFSWIKQRIG